ncbi:MAG: ABC transporter permease [Defluviitaleaceae bacterium]|nr:ABC transporter permease [Defluviitaleaceae bacterium]
MILENIGLALQSLVANKMRALLTMLGIIIGIMSIIAIMIIGDALSATVSDELAMLGADNIMVGITERDPDNDEQDEFALMGSWSITGRRPTPEDLISDQMIEDMRHYFGEDILGIALSRTLANSVQVRDLELYANVHAIGANPDYFASGGGMMGMGNMILTDGRLIDNEDLAQNAMVAVVSDSLVARMFPDYVDPIGQQVRLFLHNSIEIYTIIGVYTIAQQSGFVQVGPPGHDNAPTNLYIPLTTASHGILHRDRWQSITIVAAPHRNVHDLTDEIQAFFDILYENNEFWRASSMNMASLLDTIAVMMSSISLAIAFIAGISLLVGGIGVMNIMLVSVTERTREIGTRKALGAKNYHIRFQFVIESLIVALCGGIIGMILGVVIGGLAANLFGVPLVISPGVIVGSMLFSMAIGVFFGIYPANRAAKLDPIEALRYE